MLLVAAIVGLFVLPAPWNLIAVAVAAVIEVAEIYFWLWFLRRYRVQTGAEGLVGQRAVVVEADGGRGKVRVHGELWNAEFEGAVAEGDEVAVSAVEGLRLRVG